MLCIHSHTPSLSTHKRHRREAKQCKSAMANARPPFFYSSSSVSNILTPRAPSFDDAGDETDEQEEERQQQRLAGGRRREGRQGGEEEGEVLPYEEWAESNLWCWGRSQDGQAGPASTEMDQIKVVPQPTPIRFPFKTSRRIVAVSCGSRHTLALDDQAIPYSWGWGLCGQLGQGDFPFYQPSPRIIPTLAPSSSSSFLPPSSPSSLPSSCSSSCPGIQSISAGGVHSAAVDLEGRVYTWGESSYGQLGLGEEVMSRASSQPLPSLVLLDDHVTPLLAAAVSCGGMHTGAVTTDGRLYTWGRGDNGQLGIGRQWLEKRSNTGIGRGIPTLVDPESFESPVRHLSCGAFHTAVVTRRGRVYTWGREEHGMLGHDVSPDKFTDAQDRPKEVETTVQMGSARSVSCGGWHTCMVTEEGKVFTCGRGEYGRLGLGDQRSHLTVVEVEGFEKEPVLQASAGGTHTMLLTKRGHLYSYGRGDYGRLGLRPSASSSSSSSSSSLDSFRPKLVASLMMAIARVRCVKSGGAHSACIVEPFTEEEKTHAQQEQKQQRLNEQQQHQPQQQQQEQPAQPPLSPKQGPKQHQL